MDGHNMVELAEGYKIPNHPNVLWLYFYTAVTEKVKTTNSCVWERQEEAVWLKGISIPHISWRRLVPNGQLNLRINIVKLRF